MHAARAEPAYDDGASTRTTAGQCHQCLHQTGHVEQRAKPGRGGCCSTDEILTQHPFDPVSTSLFPRFHSHDSEPGPRTYSQPYRCKHPATKAHAVSRLWQEVQLPTSKAANDRFDQLSTLYGIVVSVDYLERAYIRDSITQEQCVLALWAMCTLPELSNHARYQIRASLQATVGTVQVNYKARRRRYLQLACIHGGIQGQFSGHCIGLSRG